MFVAGDDYWGKVDWVPGLFYVKTRFLHIWWFPIIPRESYLFLDDPRSSGPPQGMRVPLRWKSVGMAWLQALLLVNIMLAFAGGCALLTVVPSKGMKIHPYVLTAIAWSIAVGSAVVYWWSCQWMSPSLTRAIELGKLIGMRSENVELHFKIVT